MAMAKYAGTRSKRRMFPPSLKILGRPVIVESLERTWEAPRAMLIMPSVTMNEGTRQRSVTKPRMGC